MFELIGPTGGACQIKSDEMVRRSAASIKPRTSPATLLSGRSVGEGLGPKNRETPRRLHGLPFAASLFVAFF